MLFSIFAQMLKRKHTNVTKLIKKITMIYTSVLFVLMYSNDYLEHDESE